MGAGGRRLFSATPMPLPTRPCARREAGHKLALSVLARGLFARCSLVLTHVGARSCRAVCAVCPALSLRQRGVCGRLLSSALTPTGATPASMFLVPTGTMPPLRHE